MIKFLMPQYNFIGYIKNTYFNRHHEKIRSRIFVVIQLFEYNPGNMIRKKRFYKLDCHENPKGFSRKDVVFPSFQNISNKKIMSYIDLMRLNRPLGIWLLLFPCLWSLSLTDSTLHPRYIFLFTLGAILMRGAGCTFNDLVDRHIDKYVARTKERPLAKGALPLSHALLFLGFQLLSAFLILLQFNKPTQLLGASSLVLVALYPFMKRYTYWPQFFLGLTFNWGALMGEMALYGRITCQSIGLYITCIFWTLAYDTLYAYQDLEDDLKIGVKSTACRFREKGKLYIGVFYGMMLLGWSGLAILTHKPFLWVSLLLGGTLILFWGHQTNLQSPSRCLWAFKKNLWVGLIFYSGILISNLLQ